MKLSDMESSNSATITPTVADDVAPPTGPAISWSVTVSYSYICAFET